MTIPEQTAAPGETGPAARRSRGESLRLGVRAMLHEQLADARTYLEEATEPAELGETDEAAVDALAYLGAVRMALGDVDEGRAAIERALALGPSRFAPNQKAGELSLRLGDTAAAADRFLTALRAAEPGTSAARAAEASLREARRRTARGIRHGAVLPASPLRVVRWVRARVRAEGEASTATTAPASPGSPSA